MEKPPTPAFQVTVRPCSAEPNRFRYDLVSTDGAHRIGSMSNFESEAMAGLRASGLTATALFDGPMTGVRFRRYVEETLVPALNPGDTVVLDNLPAHKVSGIRERIEAVGVRLLYLPAYSPDFNPIKLAFAKLKACLRDQAARTVADLCDTLKQAFERFTPVECRNYLMAAGYDAFDPT